MNPLKQLDHYLAESLYTPLLSFLMAGAAFFISIRYRKRHPQLGVFRIYFAAYIFVTICVFLTAAYGSHPSSHAVVVLSPLFDLLLTIIEFLVFIRYFAILLPGARNRFLLRLIRALFLLVTFILFSRDLLFRSRLFQDTLQVIFVVQAACLIAACFLYFINIFRHTPVSRLRNEPGFWVATGLSFMMVCTFPLSLFLNYVEAHGTVAYDSLFAIFYIFYCLLFLMIIRAYLCSPTSSK